jgi:hypothetical protein
MPALVGLALSGPAPAVDLAKIDRSLRAEPAYQSKQPQYCLLVFGPEARTRVWVVLDGNVLYLDRNGTGDLTDPGERIAAQEVCRNSAESLDVEVMRRFERTCWQAGDEPILTCGPEVQWFQVVQLVPRADWHDQAWVKFQQERPYDFAVTTKTGHCQRAKFRFATSPQEAPIVHFDGPLRLELDDIAGPFTLRHGESSELYVRLTTPGLNARVTTDHNEIPKQAHPVAQLEFPPGRPGGEPIRLRVELTERC